MSSWSYFRTSDGRVPVFPSVVEATGDAECAHFLAVMGDLTARAGGPFVLHTKGPPPLWSDVYPTSMRSLQRLITLIFDSFPDTVVSPLDVIRSRAFRDGRRNAVYHFDHPEILQAYLQMAFPTQHLTGGIKAGRFWWDGPVDELKRALLEQMRSAGYLGDLCDQRVYDCLDLVLTEQLRAVRDGSAPNSDDMTGNLKAFILRRYAPRELSGLKYDWLRYDAFWSLMIKLTGLNAVRPSAKVQGTMAYRLDLKVADLMKKIRAAGITDETYLRACVADASRRKLSNTLDRVLNPPPTLYL